MTKLKRINLASASAQFDNKFNKQAKDVDSDVMSNRKFIAPSIAWIWFWIVSASAVISALVETYQLIQINSGRAIVPPLVCVLVILLARMMYECIVVFFAIENNTRKSRDYSEKNAKTQIESNNVLSAIRDALMRIEAKMDSPCENKADTSAGIVVHCPHCRSEMELPSAVQVGQNICCPVCGKKFQYVVGV